MSDGKFFVQLMFQISRAALIVHQKGTVMCMVELIPEIC